MHTVKQLTTLIAVVSLIQLSQSVTFKQYYEHEPVCQVRARIDKCITNPLWENTYGNVNPNGCALDYYHAQACWNAFSKCQYSNANESIPVHCWNCLVQSPSESDTFQMYQNCLNQLAAYHTLGASLALLLVIAIFFI